MIFGSLFAGVGGIDLGLERAGMICKWQVEIDDYATRVLEKHWPDVPKYRDVRDVGRNLEPVDLIAGGFPCQPHSVAGKRRGAADDRNLWPEFSRVVRETRPRYVLAENVPGIITTYLDTVLSDLEGQGYTCWTFNIPACAFDAPHRRERIFIVAYTNSLGRSYSQERQGAIPKSTGTNQPMEGRRGAIVADTTGPDESQYESRQREEQSRRDHTEPRSGWWTVEPNVGRVASRIPSRVDRLRCLGNAVVPQVVEWIGRRILEFDQITGAIE